jgi:hypothetical protein
MSELAGHGNPDWLPASVRRARDVEDRSERRQAREDEQARADHREASHDRALAASRAQLEASGEHVTAMSLVTGEGLGRTAADVLQMAEAAGDREDARAASRDQLRGTMDAPEYLGAGDVVLARHEPVYTRRQLYVKRLLDKFRQAHPGADVVERAQFAQTADRSWMADHGLVTRRSQPPAARHDAASQAGQMPYREITR